MVILDNNLRDINDSVSETNHTEVVKVYGGEKDLDLILKNINQSYQH